MWYLRALEIPLLWWDHVRKEEYFLYTTWEMKDKLKSEPLTFLEKQQVAVLYHRDIMATLWLMYFTFVWI